MQALKLEVKLVQGFVYSVTLFCYFLFSSFLKQCLSHLKHFLCSYLELIMRHDAPEKYFPNL